MKQVRISMCLTLEGKLSMEEKWMLQLGGGGLVPLLLTWFLSPCPEKHMWDACDCLGHAQLSPSQILCINFSLVGIQEDDQQRRPADLILLLWSLIPLHWCDCCPFDLCTDAFCLLIRFLKEIIFFGSLIPRLSGCTLNNYKWDYDAPLK